MSFLSALRRNPALPSAPELFQIIQGLAEVQGLPVARWMATRRHLLLPVISSALAEHEKGSAQKRAERIGLRVLGREEMLAPSREAFTFAGRQLFLSSAPEPQAGQLIAHHALGTWRPLLVERVSQVGGKTVEHDFKTATSLFGRELETDGWGIQRNVLGKWSATEKPRVTGNELGLTPFQLIWPGDPIEALTEYQEGKQRAADYRTKAKAREEAEEAEKVRTLGPWFESIEDSLLERNQYGRDVPIAKALRKWFRAHGLKASIRQRTYSMASGLDFNPPSGQRGWTEEQLAIIHALTADFQASGSITGRYGHFRVRPPYVEELKRLLAEEFKKAKLKLSEEGQRVLGAKPEKSATLLPLPLNTVVRLRGSRKRWVVVSVPEGTARGYTLEALSGGDKGSSASGIPRQDLEVDSDQQIVFSGAQAQRRYAKYKEYLTLWGNAPELVVPFVSAEELETVRAARADKQVAEEQGLEVVSDAEADVFIRFDSEKGLTVEGDTKPYRATIKEYGFRWSRRQGLWYYPKSRGDVPPIDLGELAAALAEDGATVAIEAEEEGQAEGQAGKPEVSEEGTLSPQVSSSETLSADPDHPEQPPRFKEGDRVLYGTDIKEVWAVGPWDSYAGVRRYHLMDPETRAKVWGNDPGLEPAPVAALTTSGQASAAAPQGAPYFFVVLGQDLTYTPSHLLPHTLVPGVAGEQVESLGEAADKVEAFVDATGMGMSALPRGFGVVGRSTGEAIARVSYNGRVWRLPKQNLSVQQAMTQPMDGSLEITGVELETPLSEFWKTLAGQAAPAALIEDYSSSDSYWEPERKREKALQIIRERGGIHLTEHPAKVIKDLAAQGLIEIREGYWKIAQKRADRAHPSDIPLQAAVAAFSGTSHVPEQRGKHAVREYASTFNRWADALRAKAKPEDQEWLASEIAQVKVEYRRRYTAWLNSRARTTSWFVTGPAGRNERREQKKHRSADLRQEEVSELLDKAARRIERELKARVALRQAEAREDERLRLLAEYDRLGEAAIRGPGTTPHMQKQIDSLRKRIERLGGFDTERRTFSARDAAEDAERLRAVARAESAASRGRASSVDARRLAERAAELEVRAKESGEQEFEFPAGSRQLGYRGPERELPSGTVTYDFDDNRIRISFDERFDRETFSEIRSSGWKWSRRHQAFSRQLTENAIASAAGITGLPLGDEGLPLLTERFEAVQKASEAAASAVQEARKARKAAAREGEGTFWDVLNAAMRKRSQFALPAPEHSTIAGKRVTPSVSRNSRGGYSLTWKVKAPMKDHFGRDRLGSLTWNVAVRIADPGVVFWLHPNSYYPDSDVHQRTAIDIEGIPTAVDVPTVIAAIQKALQEQGFKGTAGWPTS